ncbi:monosaccharide ABC transporter ATP-binding protein, CUT2 family [Nakamurella panacisegetis]|uniref:Monosaccharide ABC transporter ATP-binding protein, CUT2 family n=1 Tax=Nakamurella panacisegetis TaxID=1090615 RepID=A0A1H0LH65_9ACTN|nr:ATP-binding cassette domain-containing protein [Nakamurella panacisegetis]SDO67260.1 monosaccharide ABC transporter ATP-binding protein, CUT2 family [Nakamurella panacisegetis]
MSLEPALQPEPGTSDRLCPPEPTMVATHITKRFGAVVALADASIQIGNGEVLGLVGDNGAGKSTLLKILSGAIAPDSGTITLEGSEIQLRRPSDALHHGIETVYQDLALVDTMSAVQNIFLGREELSGRRGLRALNLVGDRSMRKQARQVLNELGVKVPSVNVGVKGMSGGQRQCLAIARAVLWGRKIVILDEPTAALGVRESGQVLDLITKMRGRGVGVIVVSHNMQQLMQVADRVTVMRLGRSIATRTVSDTSAQEIVGLITGAVPPDEHADQHATASVVGTPGS